MDPNFTYHHLRQAADPEVLARGRRLADQIEDLDWDEHSIWGSLGEIDAGSLLLHHSFRPLAGECPCQIDDSRLCEHLAALALAYLGDGDDLETALNLLPKATLVTLLREVTEHSEDARRIVRTQLHE